MVGQIGWKLVCDLPLGTQIDYTIVEAIVFFKPPFYTHTLVVKDLKTKNYLLINLTFPTFLIQLMIIDFLPKIFLTFCLGW